MEIAVVTGLAAKRDMYVNIHYGGFGISDSDLGFLIPELPKRYGGDHKPDWNFDSVFWIQPTVKTAPDLRNPVSQIRNPKSKAYF